MTIEDLRRVRGAVIIEIAKRSAMAAGKSLTIGHERLDTMLAWIDEAYKLSGEDRDLLRPMKSTDLSETAAVGAGHLRNLLGGSLEVFDAKKVIGIMKTARKSNRVLKAASALAVRGTKAAEQVAKTGKTTAKSNPYLLILQLLYTGGTTGWFTTMSVRHNRACYKLLVTRLHEEGQELTEAALT